MSKVTTDDANHSREEELIALAKVLDSIKASMTYYATKAMPLELGIMRGFQLQLRNKISELVCDMEAQDELKGISYSHRDKL